MKGMRRSRLRSVNILKGVDIWVRDTKAFLVETESISPQVVYTLGIKRSAKSTITTLTLNNQKRSSS